MSRTSGTVFDIQHFAVHDGPGIRTLVFLKGCPLACVWCCNPESQSREPVLRRLALRCQACLRCARVCPAGAVTMADGIVTFDRALCGRCQSIACASACCSQALLVSGERLDADTVVARVAADLEFYRNSGGGVTFSGGEPFAQSEFLGELLTGCRSLGIHAAVETCGQADTRRLLALEPLIDLFLFDLKLADTSRHRRLTGADNALVLRNLAALASRNSAKVVCRVPLVPGLTDDSDNLSEIAAIAKRLGLLTINLQPYHPLGRDKYQELGMPAPPDVGPVLRESVDRAMTIFAGEGLRVELA